MTTLADAAADIKTQMVTQWTALHPTVRLLWGNDRLDPVPDTGSDAQGWAAVEIRTGVERAIAFGGYRQNRWRQSGEVVIRIFVPVTVGETLIRTLAADACSIFRGWQPGDLKFFAASTTGGDIAEDGDWYELDVIASFLFDLTG